MNDLGSRVDHAFAQAERARQIADELIALIYANDLSLSRELPVRGVRVEKRDDALVVFRPSDQSVIVIDRDRQGRIGVTFGFGSISPDSRHVLGNVLEEDHCQLRGRLSQMIATYFD